MSVVLLDRDGVINQDSPAYIKRPEEWHPIEGSLEAIAALNQAGFQVAIATNQSGIGRGFYDKDTLNAIHDKMLSALLPLGGEISHIFYCPHTPEDFCDCRKPKPGLLYQAQKTFDLPHLQGVPFVGDSRRDIEAAQNAGALPILVKTGNGTKASEQDNNVKTFDNLWAFSQYWLKEHA